MMDTGRDRMATGSNGIPSFKRGGWTPTQSDNDLFWRRADVPESNTTAVVQRYLDALAGDQPAEPIIRTLLDQSVRRLHLLCASLLHRSYPRLTRPPLNLQADELLGAVVERLLKALREARPGTVRQFFALAGQHMRWELNDLARRLDNRPAAVEL